MSVSVSQVRKGAAGGGERSAAAEETPLQGGFRGERTTRTAGGQVRFSRPLSDKVVVIDSCLLIRSVILKQLQTQALCLKFVFVHNRQRAELEDLRKQLEDNSSLAGKSLREELEKSREEQERRHQVLKLINMLL